MEIYHATLLIALAMIAIEVMTTTFYFLGIAAGFLVVAVVQFLTGNLEIGRDAIVFSRVRQLTAQAIDLYRGALQTLHYKRVS